jgi:hypothetical protein
MRPARIRQHATTFEEGRILKRGPVIDTVFVSEQRQLVIERQHGGQLELTLKWRCAAAAIAKKRVVQERAAALIRGSLVLTQSGTVI